MRRPPPPLSLATATLAIFALSIHAQTDETPPLEFKKPVISSNLSGRDLAFLTKANEEAVLMDYLAELAKSKGESAPVRELGERFAAAQAEETNTLIELASGKGLSFKAQTPPAIKKIHARLGALTDAAFDKACVAELAALAKNIVANYETGAQSKDTEIKAFAEAERPHVRERLDATGKVAESLPKTAKSAGPDPGANR